MITDEKPENNIDFKNASQALNLVCKISCCCSVDIQNTQIAQIIKIYCSNYKKMKNINDHEQL